MAGNSWSRGLGLLRAGTVGRVPAVCAVGWGLQEGSEALLLAQPRPRIAGTPHPALLDPPTLS